MVDFKSWMGPLVVVVLILAAGSIVYYPLTVPTHANTQTTTAEPLTVNLAYKAGTGFYLVNGSGFTLYFRSTDPGNGTSTCTGKCVTAWPLFYLGSGEVYLPPSLTASTFGNATRTDGLKETTFNGFPLYYYVKDTAPGQTNGEAKGNFYACCSVLNMSATSTTGHTP
jgi:predicted lipoprotein with Yx(FWY)xxD motif